MRAPTGIRGDGVGGGRLVGTRNHEDDVCGDVILDISAREGENIDDSAGAQSHEGLPHGGDELARSGRVDVDSHAHGLVVALLGSSSRGQNLERLVYEHLA